MKKGSRLGDTQVRLQNMAIKIYFVHPLNWCLLINRAYIYIYLFIKNWQVLVFIFVWKKNMNQYFAISNYVDCLTHLWDVQPFTL